MNRTTLREEKKSPGNDDDDDSCNSTGSSSAAKQFFLLLMMKDYMFTQITPLPHRWLYLRWAGRPALQGQPKTLNSPSGIILYLEFVVMILFSVQVPDGDDPSSVRIDPEWEGLLALPGSWLEAVDLVGDPGVVPVIRVVGLDTDDAVPYWNVLHDGLLEEGRVESRGIVVDVPDVDQQLGRV